MMKFSTAIGVHLAAMGIVSALGTGAAAAATAPNPKDLTQGVWEADMVKSKFCKAPPKKSMREITELGWGLIVVHWTGNDENDKPVDTRYVYRYDGKKYPATVDSPAAESITWKLVNPHRVEFIHWSKEDKRTEELYRTVSEDGQEMTQSRKYLGGSKECVDVQVFKRK